jgi:hypothetical protein
MHRRTRSFQLVTVAILGFTSSAFAQETAEMPAPETAAPVAAPEPGSEAGAVPAAEDGVAAPVAPVTSDLNAAKYGLAFRFRWVTVPSWFLGLFTKMNSPLSSYGYALEGFRRKRDKDDPRRTWEINVGIGYQNMSPPDGYWLGPSNNIATDTYLVQARDFSLITMDAAFVSRQYFSRYFGIHYGAGLGLAVVRGQILRTSATCDPATGQCHVQINQVNSSAGKPDVHCGHAGEAACTETDLRNSEGQVNQVPPSDNAHRFVENSIPGAIPIINLLFGLDFPIPDAKGLEFRLEGGFFDAFFLGGTMGYVF